MLIDHAEDLGTRRGHHLAIEVEVDRLRGNIAGHALMIVERVVLADDQQVGVAFHLHQVRPLGCHGFRIPLHVHGEHLANRHLQRLAIEQGQSGPVAVRGVLARKHQRTVHALHAYPLRQP